jgi:hypothetical protein
MMLPDFFALDSILFTFYNFLHTSIVHHNGCSIYRYNYDPMHVTSGHS